MAILFIILAYLFGSIPFGLLIGRLKGVNLRQVGSGNIGATNVARALGKKYAFLVFLLDGIKGLIPVLLAKEFLISHEQIELGGASNLYLIGIAAVIGHIFPIWLKFRGGKGVATTFMTYFGFNCIVAIGVMLSWLSVFVLFRISSLSAIIAITVGIFLSYLSADYNLIMFSALSSIIVIARHKDNIIKLCSGKESKF
ncbi:glycerol-3-phosphate 1-O-acyltransferase PlsY [Candidatus Deianiraea vastatrix]|uniref:Glycerol-3-phosphate acyltransferase n=1 Tax=Candidatus Deianiraea vastatrix TaxID=2163644 RepID=A0A5B8XCU4_9RICK|nr:glycerol-3-phosphate 1-O-acyltransferase PlsY [Candidatus Deianiraea vastatrix]QED23178.1 Glycerol-3-phosphate acyltransferase [Candidatus Deianiraea vastatrix]